MYDDKRSLVYSGPLGRRWNEKMSQLEVPVYRWIDLHVALLDNYRKPARTLGVGFRLILAPEVLLLKPENRPGGMVKRSVVSRVSTFHIP